MKRTQGLSDQQIAINILILFSFILGAIAKASYSLPDPRREVISIYNDNFTTPESRVPYFIAVYRCVEADHNCRTNNKGYPVQSNKTKIEIVVPDLTNNNREPLKKKFYKYVVYNHTSCKCGELEDRILYGEIHNNETSEDEFKNLAKKNPPNLLKKCNYCITPQPRYKLHPYHQVASPEFRYLVYKQCLPGCIVISCKPFNKSTHLPNKEPNKVQILLTNDTSCVAYDAPCPENPSSNPHTRSAQKTSFHSTFLRPSNLSFNKKNESHEINVGSVYIGSPKIILAAFLLSLVLSAILQVSR